MDKTFRDKYKKKRGKETNKEKTGSFFFFRVVGTFFIHISSGPICRIKCLDYLKGAGVFLMVVGC